MIVDQANPAPADAGGSDGVAARKESGQKLGPIKSVAARLNVHREALRQWVRQVEIDEGVGRVLGRLVLTVASGAAPLGSDAVGMWTRMSGGRSVPGSRPAVTETKTTEGGKMFVQVIQGTASDPEQLQAAMERWARDVAPGAVGWLGSTGGVTDDGRFIALARFESEEAARRNSDRPEQDRWWSETAKLLEGAVTFRDSSDVTVDLSGDPDQAGFVQVMQGRGTDPDRARELMSQDADKWAEFRPDILGSVAVGHEGGAYTMAMYFTSEADAREGERKEVPPELAAQMEEMNKLSTGEPEFFDLKQPWLHSPH